MKQDFFATCPKGVEQLLARELSNLACDQVRETVAGVSFNTDMATAYRVCLWSRLANLVLVPLDKFAVTTADDLYQGVKCIDWVSHLNPEGRLWIDFSGTSDELRNTQFAAQKVKDAIVDRIREASGTRPSIDRDNPDLVVSVRLNKGQVTVNLDMCGESLHRRGYRSDTVKAPLKENLAAALLVRAGWPEMAMQGGTLIDPMCGSGTLLIEAAWIAADVAPGLMRANDPERQFAFECWPNFQSKLWDDIKQEADARMASGFQKPLPDIFGYDENVLAVRSTERNLQVAGLENWVSVRKKSLAEFTKPTHKTLAEGLLISNPPYGERLSDEQSLQPLYQRLGAVLKSDFVGWRGAIFTANPALGKTMGLRAAKKYKFFNGALPTELLLFDVRDEYFVQSTHPSTLTSKTLLGNTTANDERTSPNDPLEVSFLDVQRPLSEGGQMVSNRLRKNWKTMRSWCEQNQVSCFRLYDADLPEYAAAIDVYRNIEDGNDYFHVQEYAAPKTINPDAAQQRFADLLHALVVTFELAAYQLSVKQRKRNKGSEQYQALTDNPFADMLQVQEYQARFWVNLWAYLDSGLFLDHRSLRRIINEHAAEKSVLNLFCYTSSVTVQAIRGGARSSVSVDMSNTYIQWSRKNFQINDVDERKHQLIQEDCLVWLKSCRQPFDIIVLDPPSFSNSKRMQDVLDIQRDHVTLIKRCMELLTPGGCLYFSNNLRSFKLDVEQLQKFSIKDISEKTIDRDFQRNPKIHRCWEIRQ